MYVVFVVAHVRSFQSLHMAFKFGSVNLADVLYHTRVARVLSHALSVESMMIIIKVNNIIIYSLVSEQNDNCMHNIRFSYYGLVDHT